MVKGLKKFQEHFLGHEESFVVIGGVACHEWFAAQGLRFRGTKDIDVVLILEAVSTPFLLHFWEFIRLGNYKACHKASGDRIYYRFSDPSQIDYPVMVELFSRKPVDIELYAGQNIVPISVDNDISSLSAILMDDSYYKIVMQLRDIVDGLPVVSPSGLLVLKARAWLDLSRRRDAGEKINGRDIDKHRNDVFRLISLLQVGNNLSLPSSIFDDLCLFLKAFSGNVTEWHAISDALKASNIMLGKEELLRGIQEYFMLPQSAINQ